MAHESTAGFRLPRHVVPRSYEIDIDATPRRKGFSGAVRIEVELREPVREIVLHARSLSLRDGLVRVGGRRHPARVRLQRERETATLHFDRELPAGPARIEIAFSGRLDPRMRGLYLARSGSEIAIVSQCEAADARAIFPCFDEPDRKATIAWRVRTDPDLAVVTNGIPKGTRRERKTGRVIHTFEPTPVLPTYLAAVAVGPFEATATRRVAGVPCRVLVPPGKRSLATFAEEVTDVVLPWFTRYFGQRYHYGKIDQVAVPGFDAGAMENAGAIFYRQELLLTDEATGSWRARKQIAETIAHEISHQWFGNRVTMAWWDDLWLNEAFATWVSHKAVDEWRPEWRIWDDFQVLRRAAMDLDALENTHPIYAPVESPAQATENFDAITYYKGCCVVRQIEAWIGPEPFREGLRAYLRRHRDGNATGPDLWRALGKAAGRDVERVARSWTEQPGFPLVRIEASERGGRTVLRLAQRRFFATPGRHEGEESVWALPVQIRWFDGERIRLHRALLEGPVGEVELEGRAAWIHGNASGIGFYRVDLDEPLLAATAAAAPRLEPVERQVLLDDLWALVVAGKAPLERYLDLLQAFAGETDYTVLESLVGQAATLLHRITPEGSIPALRTRLRDVFAPSFDALGWEARDGEGPDVAVARAAAIAALGDLCRDPTVLRRARVWAEREKGDPAAVDPNLAAVVVRLAAIGGDKRRLQTFVAEYLARSGRGASPEEQGRWLRALSAFESPAALRALLELCTTETIPQEQLPIVLRGLLARPRQALVTWRFLQRNWESIAGRIGPMAIGRLIEALGVLPRRHRPEVERFFARHPVPEAARSLQQALEEMDLYEELRRREGPRLAAWAEGN